MPSDLVNLGSKLVGDGQPTYVIAEIGINHNGSIDIAKKLIEASKRAGCDAVKFQKRTAELCVPKDQWNIERDTPWGRMTYIDYRRKIEFTREQYTEIDKYCKQLDVAWFVSCWDEQAVDDMEYFDTPCYKAASASLTDLPLLRKMRSTGRPLMISTGMSSQNDIDAAVDALGTRNLLIAHSTSSYPCPVEALNLRVISHLKSQYPMVPIGYSGHETGLTPTWAAVTLGATFVERHVTLDRAMWGTDQAASIEPGGLMRLVENIRDIEIALGDGVKRVHPSEVPSMKKLRRVPSQFPEAVK